MTTRILIGDCRAILKTLPDDSIDCVVTSPPYFGLRDYGYGEQIGLEASPAAYVAEMVAIFHNVRRVLKKTGTLWLNLGDSYSSIGHKKSNSGYGTTTLAGGKAQEHSPLKRENNGTGKHKDLIGIPWRVAFALQDDGWYLRQDIIWHKLNPMPESVTDRCTKAHEYVFLLSKSAHYFYDSKAIAEPLIYSPSTTTQQERPKGFFNGKWAEPSNGSRNDGSFRAIRDMRNKRSVWSLVSRPFPGAHFATFPPKLVELCLKAGCPPGGVVLDPFGGAGTTSLVADRMGLDSVLIELNPEYAEMAKWRLIDEAGMFARIAAE